MQTGQPEPVSALVLDEVGEPLSGATNVRLRVRRLSDAMFLDWQDNTFKPYGSVVQPSLPLVEADALGAPGLYHLDHGFHSDGFFHPELLSNPVSPDVYLFLLHQEGLPQTASNLPQIGELKVGGWLDFINEAISSQATPAEVLAQLQSLKLHYVAAQDATAAPPTAGSYLAQLVATTSALPAYSVLQSYAYDPAANTLSGSVWVESRNLVITNAKSATVHWFDARTEALLFSSSDVLPDARGVFFVEHVAPLLVRGAAYYSLATVTLADDSVVQGVKGSFTF